MSVVIGVLDISGVTDNIVFIDFKKKSLTWIPRDLYAYRIRSRVNEAYRLGGHSLFIEVINKLGYKAEHSICVSTQACINVFSQLKLVVPIAEYAEYHYPLKPFTPIESGRKTICFQPPQEELVGERIHHFLGARFRIDKNVALPDFDRILRQQVFVKCLLEQHFNFKQFLIENISFSHPDALDQLHLINSQYEFKLANNCFPVTIQGMKVLFKKTAYAKIFKIYLNRIDPTLRRFIQ